MNKKAYIYPEVTICRIADRTQMLCSSAPKGTDVYDGDDADQNGTVLSRRHQNVWDDEEEEDLDY